MLPEEAFRIFKMKVDFIPPSENKIRIIRVIRGKPAGMAWTKDAKDFKKKFKNYVHENKAVPAALFSSAHLDGDIYDLYVEIGMPLINKTYGKKNGSKTRYKKNDIANRRKLVEDALSEVLSIDDSLFFGVTMVKVHSEETFLRVSLTQVDPSAYGVDGE